MLQTLSHTRWIQAIFAAAWLAAANGSAAEPAVVPNPKFDQGSDSPTAWRLVGVGRWVQRQFVEVTGDGNDSSHWQCPELPFEPRRLYRFEVQARRAGGTGCAITGPTFANRDQSKIQADWRPCGHIFWTPDRVSRDVLRVGQWHATGAIQFTGVRLVPVLPIHRRFGELELGEGESIRDGQYVFSGSFGHESSNYHRPLLSATAGFNSDRWCFGSGSQVTYRFAPAGQTLRSAKVQVNVSYHTGGKCVVEASSDGQTWQPVAAQDGLGNAAGDVPTALLPQPSLLIRIRGEGSSCNLQVNQVDFQAQLTGQPPAATGATSFAELQPSAAELAFEEVSLARDLGSGKDVLNVAVKNTARQATSVRLLVRDPLGQVPTPEARELNAQQVLQLQAALPASKAGSRDVQFEVRTGTEQFISAKLTLTVPDFYRSDYGEKLLTLSDGTPVWWCDATHKVPRQRPVPEVTGAAARLEAARHDYEAVQIVVRPTHPLRNLTARAAPLVGPGGATIAPEHIRILRVYYHLVHTPTDETGVRDYWPDALPPLEQPLNVDPGQNQPLWVLIHVPADARPGDYTGQITLAGEGFTCQVPLQLHVWNFTLPEQNHLETAFGLSPWEIFRYHGIRSDEDKRKVLDLYLRSFAEHRISPYDPAPLDPIGVKFLPQENPPRAELDFTAYDREVTRVLAQYHFTGLVQHIPGMGGGTFFERNAPKIGEFGEATPQYQALFASCAQQIEKHLREKGWLDKAYVYWFDEPEPRDYEFVAQGMRRLQRFAPGLRRMLTEEPGDNALAGLIDIWCPISNNYDHAQAEQRRQHGERLWWYVCCGPKAPHCTLFIDHPATDLRAWHWQTWQRKIVGTLVWQTNYWTSSAAFPDAPQNPYEDPMGYVSGYGLARGARQFWGNGDGRFIYPPLAAAVPGKSGPEPVLAPPVSSIRWEMLREGVEDYEFLYRLRELLGQQGPQLTAEQRTRYAALLEVPAAITADMTTFSTDPTPIYQRRRAVAEAIETLSGLGR